MRTTDGVSKRISIETERPYECRTCGRAYAVEHYVCPACGGFSVER